ncbi:hypothetical protein PCC7418_1207 [Halothece sp. PCC 7418]|uniref:hypothetical protein n=1 Tax=Halothece sp. (strain PCC 7418) TaxID=65093 RepID=UPI0002A087FF|nr:hypothetical protein [Halothece sp. PCC 7418]AFZ43409.1 hypothetical protein PCC7418_1207 [Halothece sp. PCC 7418]
MMQQLDSNPEAQQFTAFIDPYLLSAARHIYQKCYEVYPEKAEQTSGVAIDRETYRGQLIFREKPVLLPWESFIPSEQLQADH